jgi:hypothetical protein
MTDRAGRSNLGCLGTILGLAFVGFLAIRIGPPWFRYEQYAAEMRFNARFASTLPDSQIRVRLSLQVDSLGLPDAARKVSIKRHGSHPQLITIRAEYDELVNIPIFGVKKVHFAPHAEEPL